VPSAGLKGLTYKDAVLPNEPENLAATLFWYGGSRYSETVRPDTLPGRRSPKYQQPGKPEWPNEPENLAVALF